MLSFYNEHINECILNPAPSFSEKLLCTIDAKAKTDVEVYKAANIDRRLFSKIRSNRYYRPSRNTAILLCLGLKLSLPETQELLLSAGFALSQSLKSDLIIMSFIKRGRLNVFDINQALFDFDQPLLFG